MSKMELKSKIDSELLPFVNKPTRYLGNEYNTVIKDLQATQFRVALCFPDLYDLGIQNITYESLYHLLNARPEVWAERTYAPGVDAEQAMLKADIPLFTLESKSVLNELDLAAFFVQDRFTYPNILNMLHLGGIPLQSGDRQTDSPLIIGFGPAFNNPEPLADYFDAFILGEPEDALFRTVDVMLCRKQEGWDRKLTLQQLAQIPNIYIPSFYQPNYNSFREFQGVTKTETTALQSVSAVEYETPPSKQHTISPLVPLSDHSLNRTVFSNVGGIPPKDGNRSGFQPTASRLTEPANLKLVENLHRELQKLLRRAEGNSTDLPLENDVITNENFWMQAKETASLKTTGIQISFPSLQLGMQHAVPPETSAALKDGGFIISPVAGSQKLRNALNINIREYEILRLVAAMLEKGWPGIRLNFTLGLPGEKEDDIRAIAELLKKSIAAAEPFPDANITVFVQFFSPGVHTPFQWEKQDSLEVLENKLAVLEKSISDLPVKLHAQDPFSASLKTVLTRGDRKLGAVIENAWREGVRFDRLKEQHRPDRWMQAFQSAGTTFQDYLSSISITVPLPWDHIDVGVSKSVLKEEKLRASQGQIHPQNKETVSIGYGGMPRDMFEKFVNGAVNGRQTHQPAAKGSAVIKGGPAAGGEKVTYGRRGRKIQTGSTVIRRKVRVRYSKTGLTRFLSHLDIIRVFSRSAKLAKIPLVYSQGIRRNPKISYGSPLPIGISSIAEYLDLEVEIGREVDLQNQFNQFLPDGLQILQYREIHNKVPALAAVINRATYEAHLTPDVNPEAWITDWLAKSEIMIKRETKDGSRDLNVRPYVNKLTCADNILSIVIDSIEGRSAKVVEVLDSLLSPYGIDYRQFRVQRTGQYIFKDNEIATPFEIM